MRTRFAFLSIGAEMATPPDSPGGDLGRFRNYLLVLARCHLPPELQSKFDPEDIVQEVLGKACANEDRFRGRRNEEIRGWLKETLMNFVLEKSRRFYSDKRDVKRERSLQ